MTVLERAATRISVLARRSAEEICGLIFADGFVFPLPNRADDPTEEYLMDMADMEWAINLRGSAPVALFHSHPQQDDPAPSKADISQLRALAQDSPLPTMLIAGKQKVRAFTWDDGVKELDLAAGS